MNFLFLAQSSSLRVFYRLEQALRQREPTGRTGFYVSASAFYRSFLPEAPDLETGRYVVVKEWELLARALGRAPDLGLLHRFEEEYGDPTLWGAIVADRRLVFGELFTHRIQYAPRFTHSQSLSIAEQAFTAVERLFDDVKPDAVVAFICTTVGEYAAYLIARKRGIPFLDLRPTRIQNYVTYGTTVSEPNSLVAAAYDGYQKSGHEDQWTRLAADYLGQVRGQSARYEGTLPVARLTPAEAVSSARRRKGPAELLRAAIKLLKEERTIRRMPPGDHHTPGLFTSMLYERILNPRLARLVHNSLRHVYVTAEQLGALDFAFFPLHTEPEVTLLVYSRPYLNQIEAARNVAFNLPVGMKLLVKDHPAAMGKRRPGYYRKLLEIPNVRIVDPGTQPAKIIPHARMVVSIAGSVGLEAVYGQKPVVTLGRTPYEILPDTMVRRVADLELLGPAIREMLVNHRHDERALTNYIAAVMSRSAAVNWYTNLLGRGGYAGTWDQRSSEAELDSLAGYTLSTLALVRGRNPAATRALAP